MNREFIVSIPFLVVFSAAASSIAVSGAELESGIAVGELVASFEVVKCAGAESDEVKVGEKLCYVCKYDLRPVVLVFARSSDKRTSDKRSSDKRSSDKRSSDKRLSRLASRLDKTVAKLSDSQLAAFISLIGSESEKLQMRAKRLGAALKLKNVPIVVPVKNTKNGPVEFKLAPNVEISVMFYVEGVVKANYSFAPEKLDDQGIEAMLDEVAAVLGK